MRFSRHEYWSGLPFLLQRIFPTQGSNHHLPHWQVDSYRCTTSAISSVRFSRSVVSNSLQPHESQHTRPPLSITNSQSSLRLTSIESVMPSNHLILSHPLLLLPPIPPSIRLFSNGSTLCLRWPKYWSFSFSISPSKEHPGLISFRMDLLAVQGTLKSLLQHHMIQQFHSWACIQRKQTH